MTLTERIDHRRQQCPKCGWNISGGNHRFLAGKGEREDRLQAHCVDCGYIWFEPLQSDLPS